MKKKKDVRETKKEETKQGQWLFRSQTPTLLVKRQAKPTLLAPKPKGRMIDLSLQKIK